MGPPYRRHMNAKQLLVLTYEALQNGTSLAGELCPACKGGSTGEQTLSVRKEDDVLLWKCHRASCSFAGASGAYRNTSDRTTTEVPNVRGAVGRTYLRESESLGEGIKQSLKDSYGLTDVHISRFGIGWARDVERLVLPVYNYRGEVLGSTLRDLSRKSRTKSKSHTDEGAISWYVNHTTPGVIIVEDQLSAIRASDYLTSVALLGTHLNDERVAEIRATGLSPIYLALDADAWAQSVKYAIQFRSTLKPKLIQLTKDIKNQTDEELRALFNSLSQPGGMT